MDKNNKNDKKRKERLARLYSNFLYKKKEGSIPLIFSFESYFNSLNYNLNRKI